MVETQIEMISKLGDKIEHVHWKDLPEEYIEQRGKIFGCGMALIPLGTGVIGIEEIYKELLKIGFDGYTTLEVAGEEAVKGSYEFLKKLESKYAKVNG